MLPPFIIEQIRRLEEEEQRERDRAQPRLELPIERHRPSRRPSHPARDGADEEDTGNRGVVIIDL